jgi:hypothetical protein
MPDYILAKLASMIGGFFGGAAILTFIRPKTIGEAFVRGGVSVGSAIIFAAPSLKWMGLAAGWDNELMAGFVVGFLAYGILGMIANTLLKNQNKDLIDVVKDIKK